jgi:hypothetical protein
MTVTANEIQVAGTHYRSPIQHWDFVVSRGMGYFDGQVTKYLTRWRAKNGLTDLKKAEHFLTKMIEVARAGQITPQQSHSEVCAATVTHQRPITLDAYCAANNVPSPERAIMRSIFLWDGTVGGVEGSLTLAQAALRVMIEAEERKLKPEGHPLDLQTR